MIHMLFNPQKIQPPQEVITGGIIFSFSRNPMYVAAVLLFFAIALMVGTWPFFVSWILLGAILNFMFVPWEEQKMEELFGNEYLNYKRKTRRWI